MVKIMEKMVHKVLFCCEIRQKAKVVNHKTAAFMVNILPEAPISLVAVDLYGPHPKGRSAECYLFVVLDTFTTYIRLYKIKRATNEKLI